MANKLESIFGNLSDVEFEDILKRCNFSFEKVEKGQGGLFINGEKVEVSELPSFIPQGVTTIMNKEKFIEAYNESMNKLKEISIDNYNLFSKWYVNHSDISDIVSDDIRISFFMRYSILMEQSIYEDNSDSLINILIGIIIDIENMNNGDE